MSNKPNLLIHTVAIKDGAVQIRYSELNAAEGMDIKQLYSCESPLPGLPTSIQAFVEDLIEMCELPEELKVNTRIDTVDVTYYGSREQDVEMLDVGLCLGGSRRLDSAKDTLKLKSPKKRAIDEDHPKLQLNKDAVPKIHELIAQATRYVKGRRITGTLFDWRAQGELFEDQVQSAHDVATKMRQEISEGLYTMAEAKELYFKHRQLQEIVNGEGKRIVFGTHGLELKTKPQKEGE